jgi:hypothetical protein
MLRVLAALLLVLALPACRTYDYHSRIAKADGLISGEQLARFGKEQSQAVAIARKLAELDQGGGPDARAAQADSAVAFARTQPDVANALADPQTHRVTVDFKSGWRVGVVPLSD